MSEDKKDIIINYFNYKWNIYELKSEGEYKRVRVRENVNKRERRNGG